jgi:hypothetical protein
MVKEFHRIWAGGWDICLVCYNFFEKKDFSNKSKRMTKSDVIITLFDFFEFIFSMGLFFTSFKNLFWEY